MKQQTSTLLLLLAGFSNAWITPLSYRGSSPLRQQTFQTTSMNAHWGADKQDAIDVPHKNKDSSLAEVSDQSLLSMSAAAMMGFAALATSPEAASAAVTSTAASSSLLTSAGSISSALFAYGHYLSIIGIVGVVFTERWTLENGPNLTEEEENRLAIADTFYGVVGLLILYTGYYRLSDPALGKGTYFYIHEPVFWLKMAMVAVLGAASLFNTTKIIQRSVARFTGDGEVEPMSEELCNRMKSICNAELTGVLFIPAAATFMARGIGYNESIPWQAEAAGVALIFLGLGFKYVNEALTFEERLLKSDE